MTSSFLNKVRGEGQGARGKRIAFRLPLAPRHLPLGFTLIEMLTTVAVLVIVLGLMVSLARDVRNRSADRLTSDLLIKLDRLMSAYNDRNHHLPAVYPFVETDSPDEDKDNLKGNALRNNADVGRA